MPDDEPAAAPSRALTLPDFTPVPREKDRHNGWKPEVQRAFIEALAETGSVKAAARRVNRADHGAYLLRRHPEAAEFRAAWDAALDIGMRRIEDVAMDRALHGHEQPVYSYGKLVGSRTVYNDRLLMFMLRNRAPERFGGGLSQGAGAKDRNAVDRMELARLKREWRREWEAAWHKERFAESIATQESIMAKLMAMRGQVLAQARQASPRVVALLDAYQAAKAEEAAEGPPEPLPLLPGVHWPQQRADEPAELEAEWEEAG